MGYFKSKVLRVAPKEINQKTDIYFHFNEIKTGRKVTDLEFIVQRKNKYAHNIHEINEWNEKGFSILFQSK